MARLGFFPNSYAVALTHVSRVAPDWDLSDALPTKLQRRDMNPYIIRRTFSAISCPWLLGRVDQGPSIEVFLKAPPRKILATA